MLEVGIALDVIAAATVIIIIITRPHLAFSRPGLARVDRRALLQFVLVHFEVFSMSRFAAPAPCLEGFNVTNRQRGPSAKPLDLFCGKRHEGPNHSYHSLIGKTTQLNQ